MLSEAEIRGALARVEHRWFDDFEIVYYPGFFEGPHVSIRGTMLDNFRPGERVQLRIETMPSPNDLASVDALKVWVKWRLGLRLGSHESRENLYWDGELLSDPHADGADRDAA